MKRIIMLSFLAITAIAGVFCMFQKNSFLPLSVENNVEALTSQENAGSTNDYPNLSASPKLCTIYKFFDPNGFLAYISTSQYSGELDEGWSWSAVDGIIETCPKKGDGCIAYTCTELPD